MKKKKVKKHEWKFLRINIGGAKEYACSHGIGHGGIHGCDGCCSDTSFPKPEPRGDEGK